MNFDASLKLPETNATEKLSLCFNRQAVCMTLFFWFIDVDKNENDLYLRTQANYCSLLLHEVN